MPLLLIFKGILSEAKGLKGAQQWGPGAAPRTRLVGLLDLDCFHYKIYRCLSGERLVLHSISQLN